MTTEEKRERIWNDIMTTVMTDCDKAKNKFFKALDDNQKV